MWYFEAYYTDMDTDKEIMKVINFDGQFLDDEKECYLYAMAKAYDMMKENELLVKVEFIAC